MSIDDLYNNLKVYEPEVKWMSSSSSSTQNMAFVSSSNNNTNSTNGVVNTTQAVNAAHGDSTAITQVNAAYSTNIDNLSDDVICAFFASQPNSPQLVHEDLQQINPDDMKEMDLRWKMPMLTMRARRAPRNQDNKNKENTRRNVPVETSTPTALVSCDGLGGYDWSDQAEEGPNYAVMAFTSSSSDSNVSNDSKCSKSCLETVELFKSQNEQLLKDLKKYELMVLVPPPYIGKFMPPTPDLSFTGLDEFVNKPVVENYKAKSSEEEPKEEEVSRPKIEKKTVVSQPKIERKIVKPSLVNKEFVKSKHQKRLLGKLLNKLRNIGKTLTVLEAIKEIGTI
ncbi:hypothetical protein Tco_0088345 [Tanacetum coccineum]